ncbi:MAG: zinc ribbon domain-containing protein [Thermoplasmata archaeon]|nr:zinc ribbon domain-containing protein [Thermoplasmata archaeon]MCI4361962.1 zinc ribbon domain-containing protein [Thermoplasmata archaeon]
MPVCPACGSDNPEDGRACVRCGLSVDLFGPVREAAGLPDSDPQFAHAVQEILSAVGDATAGGDGADAASVPPTFHPPPTPAALPSTGSPRSIDSLPVLPSARGVEIARRQVEEYLQIARRQGIDTGDFTLRARDAVAADDAPSFEVLGRELFIHIAGAFTEQFESLVARRNALSSFAPTSGPDVEFESCRAALALGDLGGAQRRLRRLDDTLSRLEEKWATVQVLGGQAELLAETIRELGGDPTPALGPLAEGRRLAKAGDLAAAEPVLARAGLALWSLLEPSFLAELARQKTALTAARDAGQDVGPALAEMREIAPALRRRSFVSVVGSYRRLRELAGPVLAAPADAPGPKL